jgi:hypothetical protein
MDLLAKHTVYLVDGAGAQLGEILIDRYEAPLVVGTFHPSAGFALFRSLFQDFEKAVELQALGVVDDLDARIAALGLAVRSADGAQCSGVHDVQIWSDGDITFRLGTPESRVGQPEAAAIGVGSSPTL